MRIRRRRNVQPRGRRGNRSIRDSVSDAEHTRAKQKSLIPNEISIIPNENNQDRVRASILSPKAMSRSGPVEGKTRAGGSPVGLKSLFGKRHGVGAEMG